MGQEVVLEYIMCVQEWDDSVDYEGRSVMVVGSGATAVTLIPALAAKASKVTMLQRSPTYIVDMPYIDPVRAHP